MKKLFIAVLALTIAASAAFATDTRVATIGQASTFLTDYTDIYFIPSTLVAYPRMISAELSTYPGDSAKGSASITWTNNEEQTWGVMGIDVNHAIFGEDQFAADLADINTAALVPFAVPLPDNKWHLFYAKKMGTMDLGLHLARAAGSSTSEASQDTLGGIIGASSTAEDGSGIWNINASIGLKPMENVTADVAFAFQMLGFSAEHSWSSTTPAGSGATTIEADGGSNILFGARAFYGMSDQLKLVPQVGVNMYKLGYKTSYSGGDTTSHIPVGGEKSATNIVGAFGLNYQPVENVMLVGGLHFGMYGSTIEDTNAVFGGGAPKEEVSQLVFPGFSAGVEAKLVKWLDVRFGASKMLTKTTTKTSGNMGIGVGNVSSETAYTSAPYKFGFGLGLTFGNLKIDGQLNPDSPFDLGYLMSGHQNEVFTMVSATYKF